MASVQSYSHNVSGEREFGFAQAIKAGETIYVSGQLSHDDQGNFVVSIIGVRKHDWEDCDKILRLVNCYTPGSKQICGYSTPESIVCQGVCY